MFAELLSGLIPRFEGIHIRPRHWAAWAVVASLSLPATAGALTVYSNFGTGDSFDSSSAQTILAANTLNHVAFSFDLPASGTPFFLDSIETVFDGSASGASMIRLRLATDADGTDEKPGQVLDSAVVTILPGLAIETIAFSGTAEVGTGTHWLWIEVISEGVNWQLNNTQDRGGQSASTNGSSWIFLNSDKTIPAFRINGTPVPEPGSMILVASTLLAVFALRRRI